MTFPTKYKYTYEKIQKRKYKYFFKHKNENLGLQLTWFPQKKIYNHLFTVNKVRWTKMKISQFFYTHVLIFLNTALLDFFTLTNYESYFLRTFLKLRKMREINLIKKSKSKIIKKLKDWPIFIFILNQPKKLWIFPTYFSHKNFKYFLMILFSKQFFVIYSILFWSKIVFVWSGKLLMALLVACQNNFFVSFSFRKKRKETIEEKKKLN